MANDKLHQAMNTVDNYIQSIKVSLEQIDRPEDYHDPDWDILDAQYAILRIVKSMMKVIDSQDNPSSVSQSYLITKAKPKKNTLYWVSYIVQQTPDDKPWVCASSSVCSSMQEALIAIDVGRKYHRILSAWIDVFDENNNKTTVMHECYVDVMGNVNQKAGQNEG